jgi:hypothetical protein
LGFLVLGEKGYAVPGDTQINVDIVGLLLLGGTMVGGFYRMQSQVNDHSKRIDSFDAQWRAFQIEHTQLLREVTQVNSRLTTLLEAMDKRVTWLEELFRRKIINHDD